MIRFQTFAAIRKTFHNSRIYKKFLLAGVHTVVSVRKANQSKFIYVQLSDFAVYSRSYDMPLGVFIMTYNRPLLVG